MMVYFVRQITGRLLIEKDLVSVSKICYILIFIIFQSLRSLLGEMRIKIVARNQPKGENRTSKDRQKRQTNQVGLLGVIPCFTCRALKFPLPHFF